MTCQPNIRSDKGGLNLPNDYPELFHLERVQGNDLANFLVDGSKVKTFLRLSHL